MSDKAQQPSATVMAAWFVGAILTGIIVSRLVTGLIPIADPQTHEYARSGIGLFVMYFLISGWNLRIFKAVAFQLVVALAGAIGCVSAWIAYDFYFPPHT